MYVAVHYAEIGLKGRNRPRFETLLRRRLKRALADVGPAVVARRFGRLLVKLPDGCDFDAARRRLERVFGVAYFGRATLVEDPDRAALEAAVDARVDAADFETFGVRTRRVDKRYPFTSEQLNRELGERVARRTGKGVDLKQPDLWLDLHLLSDEAILLWEKLPGPGGMPVGSAGRGVSLISGGIDSPVASFRMLRRGLELVYAHFHSAPYTSEASQLKVRDVLARLARYSGPALLLSIPFGAAQQQLVRDAPAAPRIVLYRRFMLRVASALARQEHCLALVTGDSLGQVSSQTLANLDTISRAATLPVLRPLIGMDKAEIIEQAQDLGTYAISVEPDEDCCSYLMPRQPATWTRPDAIDAVEAELDVERIVADVLAGVTRERVEALHD